jgi:hypothetical protein
MDGRNTLALLEAAIRDVAAAIGSRRPLVQPLGTLSAAASISANSEGRPESSTSCGSGRRLHRGDR